MRTLETYYDERFFEEFALFKSGESTGMEIFSNLVVIAYQLKSDNYGRLKQSGSSKQSKGFSFADILIGVAGVSDVSPLSNIIIFESGAFLTPSVSRALIF